MRCQLRLFSLEKMSSRAFLSLFIFCINETAKSSYSYQTKSWIFYGLAKERKYSFVTFFPYKWSYPTLSERNNTFLMAIKAIISFCHVQLWVVDCIKLSFISSSKISFFLLPVQPSTCRMGTDFFFQELSIHIRMNWSVRFKQNRFI